MKFRSRVARIENALSVVAGLIDRYDEEAYVPVFEHLEQMLEEERSKGDALTRARRLAATKAGAKPITFR